ncbi:MAG: hypothetical protein GC165_04145 [Armatimonadetes bacterium]|nr:hypothetical protein [Armatimonadota bacterium]
MKKSHATLAISSLAAIAAFAVAGQVRGSQESAHGASPDWTISISGGHETEGVDRGRPVNLVAGGLGVKPEVFREAFSHVRPAPAGQRPDEQRVHMNKQALLSALQPYGITNEQLDTVSNYYRYRREQGEMWPTAEATAVAILQKGALTSIKIDKGGSGYNSVPTVTIAGHPEIKLKAVLSYGKDLKNNGSISEIQIVKNL